MVQESKLTIVKDEDTTTGDYDAEAQEAIQLDLEKGDSEYDVDSDVYARTSTTTMTFLVAAREKEKAMAIVRRGEEDGAAGVGSGRHANSSNIVATTHSDDSVTLGTATLAEATRRPPPLTRRQNQGLPPGAHAIQPFRRTSGVSPDNTNDEDEESHIEGSGRRGNNSNNRDDVAPTLITTARVVSETEELDAQALREQLYQLQAENRNVLAATLVTVEQIEQQHDANAKKTRQIPLRRTLAIAGFSLAAVVGAIIAVVLVVLPRLNGPETALAQAANDTTATAIAETPPLPTTTLLQPTLQTIRERGFIRCRAETWQRDQGSGLSLDLVRTPSPLCSNGS